MFCFVQCSVDHLGADVTVNVTYKMFRFEGQVYVMFRLITRVKLFYISVIYL